MSNFDADLRLAGTVRAVLYVERASDGQRRHDTLSPVRSAEDAERAAERARDNLHTIGRWRVTGWCLETYVPGIGWCVRDDDD